VRQAESGHGTRRAIDRKLAVTRIFLTLAILANVLLAVAFVLGLMIGDPRVADAQVQAGVSAHFLTAVGALVFAALVHAIVLTYFMGTGRWIEETGDSYPLPAGLREDCKRLKYRVLPVMAACLVLLILAGATGAAADPASPYGAQGIWGIPSSKVHFFLAAATLCVNLLVSYFEYAAISANGNIVESVLQAVRRIRLEKGLPV
jgi:hypothetical protein